MPDFHSALEAAGAYKPKARRINAWGYFGELKGAPFGYARETGVLRA